MAKYYGRCHLSHDINGSTGKCDVTDLWHVGTNTRDWTYPKG